MEITIPITAYFVKGDMGENGYEIYRDDRTNLAYILDDGDCICCPWDDRFYDGLTYKINVGWVLLDGTELSKIV